MMVVLLHHLCLLGSPEGLPSPPAFLPESFPSLDGLFDEKDNEPQALYQQAVPVAASQPRLKTDHNRPNISLIDGANNVAELMSKGKEKPPLEPENITFSEELSKLFPEANEKMIKQEDETPNLPIQDLDQVSSKIGRGEIPKQLNFLLVA